MDYVYFDISACGTFEFEDGEVVKTEDEIAEHLEGYLYDEFDTPHDGDEFDAEVRVAIRRDTD